MRSLLDRFSGATPPYASCVGLAAAAVVLVTYTLAFGNASQDGPLRQGIREFRSACQNWDYESFADSINTLDLAITQKPDSASAYYWKGAAQFHLVLLCQSDTADTDKGIDLKGPITTLEKALKLSPSDGESHALLGVLIGMQIADNALSALWRGRSVMRHQKAALKLAPNNPRAYYLLGASSLYAPDMLGGTEQALKYFLRAEQLYEEERAQPKAVEEPRWGFSHCLAFIGQIYQDRSQLGNAMRYYRKALKHNAHNGMAQKGLEECRQMTANK